MINVKSPYFIYLLGAFINIFSLTIIKYIGIKNIITINQLIFLRTLLSLVMFCPFGIRHAKEVLTIGKKDLALISLLCILATLDTYLWNIGLQKVPINNAILIAMMTPITTTILAGVFLKEKVTKGIKLVFLINTISTVAFYGIKTDQLNVGYLILFADLFVYGTTAIVIKKLSSYSAGFLVFIRMAALLPVSFLLIKDLPKITTSVAILVIIVTIGYTTQRLLITKAYQMAKIVSLQPLKYFNIVFSSILGYFILKEPLSLQQIMSFIFIISTTFLIRNDLKKD